MKKLLLLLFLLPVTAKAQGLIIGTTLDNQGNIVAGATVTVCALGSPGIPCTPATASGVSNSQGAFSISVAIGTYTVTTFRPGIIATTGTVVTQPSNIVPGIGVVVPGSGVNCCIGAINATSGGSLAGSFSGNPAFVGSPTFVGTISGSISGNAATATTSTNLLGPGSVGGSFTGNPTFTGNFSASNPCTVGNVLYVDPGCFTGADIGAQVNSAIALCPTTTIGSNTTNNCIISLEHLRGVIAQSTQIAITNNTVSLRGPGSSQLILNCSYTPTGLDNTAGCIRVYNNNFGGNYNHGVTISGLFIQGGSQANGVGIHAGDMLGLILRDIQVYNFTGTGAIGIWLDNRTNYTEQLRMEDILTVGNTTCMRYSINGSGQTSFGYGWYQSVIIQPGAGQTGMIIDPNSGSSFPTIYHSTINWIFEDATNAAATFLQIGANAALADNEYHVFFEDQGGQGSTIMNLASNSMITGAGFWQMWNKGSGANVLNIAGTPCGGSTGSTACNFSTVLFNVDGRVDANNGATDLLWSPLQGNISLTNWGTGATVTGVRGQWKHFQFTVTAGTTPSANPTVTVAFPSTGSPGFQTTFRNPPMMQCFQIAGTGSLPSPIFLTGMNNPSTTTVTGTWTGTPVNASTYIFNCNVSNQ